jgi:hypothetical protein
MSSHKNQLSSAGSKMAPRLLVYPGLLQDSSILPLAFPKMSLRLPSKLPRTHSFEQPHSRERPESRRQAIAHSVPDRGVSP